MSEQCERTSEWRTEWPITRRVDFIVILPIVHRCEIDLLKWAESAEKKYVQTVSAAKERFYYKEVRRKKGEKTRTRDEQDIG